jgi:hypothetical protein
VAGRQQQGVERLVANRRHAGSKKPGRLAGDAADREQQGVDGPVADRRQAGSKKPSTVKQTFL